MRGVCKLFIFALFLTLLSSACLGHTASAVFSGSNGKILYTKYLPYDYNTPYQTSGVSDGNLYIANPDGTDEQVLKSDYSSYANFSPGGQRIVWSSSPNYPTKWQGGGQNIYSSNLDGTNIKLEASGQNLTKPTWSPSGQLVYYTDNYCCTVRTIGNGFNDYLLQRNGIVSPNGDFLIAGIDGSPAQQYGVFDNIVTSRNTAAQPSRIIDLGYGTSTPIWSPDSTRIASARSSGIRTYTISLYSTTSGNLIKSFTYSGIPANILWSPDGTSLYVAGDRSTVPLYSAPPDYTVTKIDIATEAQSIVAIPWIQTLVDWQSIGHPNELDPQVIEGVGSSDIFRFYSPITKRHMFTASYQESAYIIQNMSSAWQYEGAPFRVKATSGCENGQNVYRFYSGVIKAHLYTMDENEKAVLIGYNNPSIWRYEGIAYCADKTRTNSNQRPVYRFYSEALKTHLYTVDENEKSTLIGYNNPSVWRYEGIAYYAY